MRSGRLSGEGKEENWAVWDADGAHCKIVDEIRPYRRADRAPNTEARAAYHIAPARQPALNHSPPSLGRRTDSLSVNRRLFLATSIRSTRVPIADISKRETRAAASIHHARRPYATKLPPLSYQQPPKLTTIPLQTRTHSSPKSPSPSRPSSPSRPPPRCPTPTSNSPPPYPPQSPTRRPTPPTTTPSSNNSPRSPHT